MNTAIGEFLRNWNKNTDDRVKVQHVYLVATIVLLFAAGIASLINYGIGQVLLLGTLSALVIFITNSVVWALVYTFLIVRLRQRSSQK